MSKSQDLNAIIEAAHESLKFGTVNLTLKKAHGDVIMVDITTISPRKVSGNAQALTLVGSMLKLLAEAGQTGNLTFTLSLKQGQADKILTQDFSRKMMDDKS
jgi:hypothetical protein